MVKSLEGGRGAAALIVAFYHFRLLTGYVPFFKYGFLFVDLFFVLSGFLICANYADRLAQREDLLPFLCRRFGRLFPLLVFATVAFVLLKNASSFAKNQLVLMGYARFSHQVGLLPYTMPDATELVTTLTMTHGLGMFDKLILNYASWSISVEFYTYLLFALVCVSLTGRRRLLAFAFAAIGAAVVTVWACIDPHRCLQDGLCMDVTADFGFPRCVASFFLGALTQVYSRARPLRLEALQWPGVAALILLLCYLDRAPALAFAMPPLFAVLLLSISRDRGWLAGLFNTRPLQVLGQRSYSVYLMHPVVLLLFEPLQKYVAGRLLPTLLAAGVFVTLLVMVSGWTYRWIEDPWRRRFNALASRRWQRVSA